MATPFGAPIYEHAADEPNGQTADPLDKVVDTIDPDDPRLTSELLDVNVEGDAYAFPAPPPDGRYRAKIKISQLEDAKKQKVDWLPKNHDKQGPYAATAVEATILDPSGQYDGIHVYDRWVGTFMQRDKSHKVQTILKLLRKPDGTPWITGATKMGHKEWILLLVKALAGEPEIGIETVWEYQCQKCGEEADKRGERRPRGVLGMQYFPVDQSRTKANAGKAAHDPNMRCQINPAHGASRAQVRISRFLSLEDLKKSA